MAATTTLGVDHHRPTRAVVRESAGEYVVELDVADFTDGVLSVGAYGHRLTVCGDALDTEESAGLAFEQHNRLEESFRLPDDTDPDRVKVFYEHGTLEIHAPRVRLEPRQLRIERPLLVNPNATPC